MRALKICCSEWNNASRDKRELSVCRELGMDVLVLAKGDPTDKGRYDEVDGYKVRRYSTRPLGIRVPNGINRIVSVFTWAKYASKLNADIISGHDLSGLTIGWISNWFKKKDNKAKLVYDSHEFEIGRNEQRSKMTTWIITHWERFMINKCAMSIMVNDSIADEVKKIHRLKIRPIVVRNIPNHWNIKQEECDNIRKQLEDQFSTKINLLLMYHGMVRDGRGIEDIICALEKLEGVGFVILGNLSSQKYYDSLIKLISEKNLNNRIIFKDAVPIDILWKYVGAADLGCCNGNGTSKSYYYGLPNKLFENIQAGTPIVVSNRPEKRKIVEKYKVGCVCERDGVDEIVRCIRMCMDNPQLLKQYRENVLIAKEELCWEKEKNVLLKAYKEICQ